MTDKPDWNTRRQYQRWESALNAMCEAYRALDAKLGTEAEHSARSAFNAAVRRVDVYTLPHPWKSWEQLGLAIYRRGGHTAG
jgi:hypothetical protein